MACAKNIDRKEKKRTTTERNRLSEKDISVCFRFYQSIFYLDFLK